MTAILCALAALVGIVAGILVARWAVAPIGRSHAYELRRVEDRAVYALRALGHAEREALRWKLRALRRGWKPERGGR